MGLLASPETASFASEAQLSVLLCLLFLVRPSIRPSVRSSICPSIHSLTQEVAESPSLELFQSPWKCGTEGRVHGHGGTGGGWAWGSEKAFPALMTL